MKKKLLYLLLALITLPVVIFTQDQLRQILTRAAAQKANILVDTKNIVDENFHQSWAAFAQGGEEPPPMLSNVVSKLKDLKPLYIRLDHIYDSYSIVEKKENGYSYDFTRLDKTVDDIISSGALPFFSLSYMPAAFTENGSLIDVPKNWDDWKNLVKETVEHYSGKTNRNLSNIYYEVWNEPELPQFGSWKLSPEKDYRVLYYHSVLGAQNAQNTNNFFIGGPGVGSYYSNWVTNLLSYITQNNLRFDFYSWHRYIKKPDTYVNDAKNIRDNLAKFPNYRSIPLILTEWGIDSDNTDLNNSKEAAVFTVSSVSKFLNDIYLAFAFEVKNGPPPNGGKWGLFTHEKDPNPLSPKLRTKAFLALSKIQGKKINISGLGTFISGMASLSGNEITLLLSNLDLSNRNIENVPITFSGLDPSSYLLKYSYVLDDLSGSYELISTNGSLSKNFVMSPNSLLLITLSPSGKIAEFIPGTTLDKTDKALILKNAKDSLVFNSPEFRLMPSGKISFDIKPFWGNNDNRSFNIFEAHYSTESGIINRMFLMKKTTALGNNIVFGIGKDTEEITLSRNIIWDSNTWHTVDTHWDPDGLTLTIDGRDVHIDQSVDIRNGRELSFYPIDAAIDNLTINIGGEQIIKKQFNDRFDK